MKIEKKKIKNSPIVSFAQKSAIAAVLGMAAVFSLNACDDSTSASDNNSNQTTGPKSSDATAPTSSTDEATPASSESVSDSSNKEQTPASSSEEQASEASSQQQSQASSSSQVVVDIPLSHEPISSSVMEALSSVTESDSSANNRCIAVPGSEITVCTQTPSSSSSSNAQSSSSSANNACTNVPGSDIIICPDQSLPHSSAMMSMVTTFEKTDIEV